MAFNITVQLLASSNIVISKNLDFHNFLLDAYNYNFRPIFREVCLINGVNGCRKLGANFQGLRGNCWDLWGYSK